MSTSVPMEPISADEKPVTTSASDPASASTSTPTSTTKPTANGANGRNSQPITDQNESDYIDTGTQETDVKRLKLKVSGFVDLSGLISNVAVLVILLGQMSHNKFFVPLVVFISLALTLQVALGLLLIIRHSFVEETHIPDNDPEEVKRLKDKSRDMLTASTVLLMVISVVNVFIVAFAGIAQDSGTALTTTSTSG